MINIHRDRFETIINFLRTYDFVKTKFSIGVVNDGPYDENGQGSKACVIGMLPLIFPNDWSYELNGMNEYVPRSKNEKLLEFLGLDKFDDVWQLFESGHESVTSFGGIPLSKNATPQEVAYNLEKFMEFKFPN